MKGRRLSWDKSGSYAKTPEENIRAASTRLRVSKILSTGFFKKKEKNINNI